MMRADWLNENFCDYERVTLKEKAYVSELDLVVVLVLGRRRSFAHIFLDGQIALEHLLLVVTRGLREPEVRSALLI